MEFLSYTWKKYELKLLIMKGKDMILLPWEIVFLNKNDKHFVHRFLRILKTLGWFGLICHVLVKGFLYLRVNSLILVRWPGREKIAHRIQSLLILISSFL